MKPFRVIIGCERSGVIRRAFRAVGVDAWSCDLEPADDNSPFHIQGDVLDHLDEGWRLGIFHPVCDYLTVSGNRWFKDGVKAAPHILTGEARRKAQAEALEFVKKLWAAPIKSVCIENPVGRLSTLWMPPTQTFQPPAFGHGELKRHCLWLRGLPRLLPTHVEHELFDLLPNEPSGREQRVFKMAPGPNRKADRSRSYAGVGKAMADQWGHLKD